MTGIDGRVNNLNRDVFSTASSIQSRTAGGQLKGTADANALKNAILRDGQVDSQEQDLLRELTSSQQNISISAQQTSNFRPADVNFENRWSRQGLAVLNSISSAAPVTNAQLQSIFSRGADGFQELASIYSRSPADAQRVTNFLAGQVGQAWEQISVTNGYGPLRSLISTGMAGVNQLEGEANAQARRMVHGAIKQVDTNADGSDGAIPNFLYNWIRPGGYL